MRIKDKFCIIFAGAIGSSKTPIANYLSGKLNLPCLSNDNIRIEITEDLGKFNQEEYIKRRDERLQDILKRNISFIFDASIDRSWRTLKKELNKFDYKWFIISLDLSKELLKEIYKNKSYTNLIAMDRTIKEHEIFLKRYQDEIGLHISDKEFNHRMQLSFKAIINWGNHSNKTQILKNL